MYNLWFLLLSNYTWDNAKGNSFLYPLFYFISCMHVKLQAILQNFQTYLCMTIRNPNIHMSNVQANL